MSDTPTISVVSPVYRAEAIVDELVRRLVDQLSGFVDFEIVLVDDRSPDGSWDRIVANCKSHSEVRGVRLSRNFGQHKAIAAGLALARGRYVVVLDCDLQDNPVHIPELFERAQGGYDIVYTYKDRRYHSRFRNLMARVYFRIVEFLTSDAGGPLRMGTGSYSMITRRVVDEYVRIGDTHAHYLMNLRQIGFDHTEVRIEHEPRFEGESSYSFAKLVHHAIDGIASQSVRLLNLAIGIGLAMFLTSLLAATYLVVAYFARGALAGYTSLMVMFLLLTGVVLMSIGIVGLYVGRIFEQGKGRPMFVIDRRVNFDEDVE